MPRPLNIIDASPYEGGPDAARASVETAPRPAQRVLIVDDNRDAAESLAMLVEVLGCEAHVCFDGEAALAAIDDWSPDLVLLDLTMPGMSGFEVARRLRARGAPLRARLVAVSGHAREEHEEEVDSARFDGHLIKPVDVATLQATLHATPLS